MSVRDAALLAVGTLTRIPVPAPATVDPPTARLAMAFAPLAVLPLGVAVTLTLGATQLLDVHPVVRGLLAVALLAFGTRMLHLDGLSDTVDGLTASTDPERSLAVMRSGTAGPAGVVTLSVVVTAQAIGFASLSEHWWSAALAGLAVCWSRLALGAACLRGVPAARPDGLGAAVAGTVPLALFAPVALLLTAAWWWVAREAGTGWAGCVAPVAAGAALVVALGSCVRRLGGITGDVLGAAVELALVVLLVSVA